MSFLTVGLQVAVAIYLLFGAITGRNKALTLRFPKKGKAPLFRKYTRIGFGVAGALLLALAGITLYAGTLGPESPALVPLSNAVMALSFVVLTILMAVLVLRWRLTDREKKNAAMTRGTAPRAAFYFDEEEQKGK